MECIGGVAHTHSLCATAWAQAHKGIHALGTTHADYFHGEIPCTRPLRKDEVDTDYEANTGKVIVETMDGRQPLSMPGVLVAEHGPFSWGESPDKAVNNASVLERVAMLATQTLWIDPSVQPIGQWLLDRHFLRKHGPDAYYGQKPHSTREAKG